MADNSNIVEFIKRSLEELDPVVNGDERPNDLMDCGYADGSWNTLVEILTKMGVEHHYKQIL